MYLQAEENFKGAIEEFQDALRREVLKQVIEFSKQHPRQRISIFVTHDSLFAVKRGKRDEFVNLPIIEEIRRVRQSYGTLPTPILILTFKAGKEIREGN